MDRKYHMSISAELLDIHMMKIILDILSSKISGIKSVPNGKWGRCLSLI